MKTATLVKRARAADITEAFATFTEDGFTVKVAEHREIIFGDFDDHMKWWTALSTPVIAEVENKPQFMDDLRVELEKPRTAEGIPFDTAVFWIAAAR
jgi:hypothetical protein